MFVLILMKSQSLKFIEHVAFHYVTSKNDQVKKGCFRQREHNEVFFVIEPQEFSLAKREISTKCLVYDKSKSVCLVHG